MIHHANMLCTFMSDYWQSEERSVRRDWDSVKIWTASKYYYPERCKYSTWACRIVIFNLHVIFPKHFFFFLKKIFVCIFLLHSPLPIGVWRWPVCVSGSGVTERGRVAGQSSDAHKFYWERCIRHHVRSDQNCGIFTLTGGKLDERRA